MCRRNQAINRQEMSLFLVKQRKADILLLQIKTDLQCLNWKRAHKTCTRDQNPRKNVNWWKERNRQNQTLVPVFKLLGGGGYWCYKEHFIHRAWSSQSIGGRSLSSTLCEIQIQIQYSIPNIPMGIRPDPVWKKWSQMRKKNRACENIIMFRTAWAKDEWKLGQNFHLVDVNNMNLVIW